MGDVRRLGNGEPVKRIKGQPTPCRTCPKIPAGEPKCPAFAVELTTRTIEAILHYRECKAVGQFPNDQIVRQNAAVIAQIDEDVKEERQRRNQRDAAADMIASTMASMLAGVKR